MPDYSPLISQAYLRILERQPDPGGLASWNRAMNDGLSEAAMREGLLRSPEYAAKHPDSAARARRGRKAPAAGGAAPPRARRRGRRRSQTKKR